MASLIGTVLAAMATRHKAWRRAHNLRSGARSDASASARLPGAARERAGGHTAMRATPEFAARRAAATGRTAAHAAKSEPAAEPARAALRWIGAGGALAALGGAALIAGHARHLAVAAEPLIDSAHLAGVPYAADAFQPALPGAVFTVPAQPGIALAAAEGGALVVAAGMHGAPPVRVDLCTQVRDKSKPRLLPLRIGYRFDDVARWVAHSQGGAPVTLRNVALAGPDAGDMPQVQVSGMATTLAAAAPLQLVWDSRDAGVRWLGDASYGKVEQGAHGQVALGTDGWLAWGGNAALRIQRRASAACPRFGELLVQLYQAGDAMTGRALVTAFPAQGQPVSAWLRAGQYRVPAAPRASLEDQALFQDLQARGLVRLGANGLAELAPRDLAAWQAVPGAERAGELAGWDGVKLDDAAIRLLKRLYRMADGEYVREQVRVFNSERRLLAWRLQPAAVHGDWQASVGATPASTSNAMPAVAARLFAEVPQGWVPWTRVAAWPETGARAPARITLALPQPAAGGEAMRLMLVGRVLKVEGARQLGQPQPACTGRACPSADAAQVLVLELLPGARAIAIDAAPLEMSALAGPADQQYRHLRVVDGKLAWQPLSFDKADVRTASAAAVTLEDRNGVALWSGGAPTRAAIGAGLAPLLGIRADHAASIAGMLARLPSPTGSHAARLTLDLGLQTASQQALDCIGMRRGRWDGKACSGGQAPPAGRHAGIVILDTETGDVLAAAGAGAGTVNAANWSEVRDFDRSNPARSPLRLPAFQHDGGAHQSPGSTFKVISALGLELAAQNDPQIDALLSGMPLAAINRLAQQRGFAFQTNAASYPADTRLAHITNYKDGHLDQRAQDGRLGLSQALTYSLNTWFAWSGELSDRSLFGRADGGAPDLQPLAPGALDSVRPIVAMAHRLGFEQALRLDGGLLPADYAWSAWDALQATPAHIDPIHTRHELRQMAIGLRMQVTPLQMALAAGAVGQGKVIAPRLLLALDARQAEAPAMPDLGVRLDRIRAGMKGVVDIGTAASAFRGARLDAVRRGLSGKTGTSPTGAPGAAGPGEDRATVWFTGWLEPGSLPGQAHRLAVAAFVSHSETTGGEHAAPIVAAVLASQLGQNREQRGK